MASDDPVDEMDAESECTSVLRDVWLFLDNEMDADSRARVQHHLDECSPCLAEAGLDRKLKQLLHRKCGGERAPEHLRSRLHTTLNTVAVTTAGDGGIERVTVETLRVTERFGK